MQHNNRIIHRFKKKTNLKNRAYMFTNILAKMGKKERLRKRGYKNWRSINLQLNRKYQKRKSTVLSKLLILIDLFYSISLNYLLC